MGRYGAGYGYGAGAAQGSENDFVRLAEESSRQAFQSIESIVQAFGSVSMMLESTYFAVHSSFRAVLGVAEHFSRLRSHLSTMTIVRTLHWFVRRLVYLLGLTSIDPNDDSAWSEATSRVASGASDPLSPEGIIEALTRDDPTRGRSSWPILIFFAVVCGTPWLIWKLLASISGPQPAVCENWLQGQDDHYVGSALYDFTSENPREVPFKAGQQLIIAPKETQPRVRGWLLATIDGKRSGLVPANYVKILRFHSSKTPTSGGSS
jgi:peroxin-13